ncbi:Embryonal Fyn-associated substrate [Manis javanica]|nr:Embryonal Fyn-associated substrate [Manis javanica]
MEIQIIKAKEKPQGNEFWKWHCFAALFYPNRGNKVVKIGGLGVVPPFLLPLVSAPFAELPTALCWDRASGGSQPLWSVGATMRRAQGRICRFRWKTSGGY